MVKKVTMKEIKSAFLCIDIGWDSQHAIPELDRDAYTCGVYGWNADIFVMHVDGNFIALVRGSRPFGIQLTEFEKWMLRCLDVMASDGKDVRDDVRKWASGVARRYYEEESAMVEHATRRALKI